MPRIAESEDEVEGHGRRDRVDESSSESDDYQHPRKAAAQLHLQSRSSGIDSLASPSITTAKSLAGPKRRVIEEDEDDTPFVPSHISQTAKPSIDAPKIAPTAHIITIASKTAPIRESDEVLLSDDDTMHPPSAKRRKLPPSSKNTSLVKKQPDSGKRKSEKRFYSDDDADIDFSDSNGPLSDEDEDSFMEEDSFDAEESLVVDDGYSDTDEEYGTARKSTKASKPSKAPKKPSTPKAGKKGSNLPKSASTGGKLASGGSNAKADLVDVDETSSVDVVDMIDVEASDYDEDSDLEIVDYKAGSAPATKKKTARQKALSGEHESEYLALTGTRNVPTTLVDPKKASLTPAALLARKPTLSAKKDERTQPPDDVLQEVNQIVTQLLHRNALERTETTRDVRNEPMFNPELTKFWSKPSGNFITVPLSNFEALFPPNLGWSGTSLTPTEAADIPVVHVNRSIQDCP